MKRLWLSYRLWRLNRRIANMENEIRRRKRALWFLYGGRL